MSKDNVMLPDIQKITLSEYFDAIEICPECGSLDVSPRHHEASFAAPECDYMQCECGHQWGME